MKWSQVFLKNLNTASRIYNASVINTQDLVVEVGPGRGVLTRFILSYPVRHFIAVEIDSNLNPINHSYIHINEDFLKVSLHKYLLNEYYCKLISNLPFHITKKFFERIVNEYFENFESLTVMLQFEFKENFDLRLTAFSRFVNTYYDIEYLFFVSRRDFSPVPSCDSYVFRFHRRATVSKIYNPKDYYSFLKSLYSGRRKMLRNNNLFKSIYSADLSDENISKLKTLSEKRVQNISDNEIAFIYSVLKNENVYE